MMSNFDFSSAVILSDSKIFSETLSRSLEEDGLKTKQFLLDDLRNQISDISFIPYRFVITTKNKILEEAISQTLSSFAQTPNVKTIFVWFKKFPFFSIVPELLSAGSNIRGLQIRDAFGPTITPEIDSPISELLISLITHKPKTELDALTKLYPVPEEELLISIKASLFRASSFQQFFYIAPRPAISLSGIVNLLGQKIVFGKSVPSPENCPEIRGIFKDTHSEFRPTPVIIPRENSSVEEELKRAFVKLSSVRYMVSVSADDQSEAGEISPSLPPQDKSSDSSVFKRESEDLPSPAQEDEPDPLPESFGDTPNTTKGSNDHLLKNSPPPDKPKSISLSSPSNRPPLNLELLKPNFSPKLFVITVPIFYLLAIFISFIGVKRELLLSFKNVQIQRLSMAQSHVKRAILLTRIGNTLSQPLFLIPSSMASQGKTEIVNLNNVLRSALDLLKIGEKSQETASLIWNGFFSGENTKLISYLDQLSQNFRQFQLNLDSIEEWGSSTQVPLPDSFHEYLSSLKSQLEQSRNMLEIIPSALGAGESKTYLVLFQNDAELRPTGGFIGSVGFISLSSGSFSNFEVYDVYSLDGQLKGHVEPPPALKSYLGEAGWYLRDSNWDPDFPTSARRAQWFVDKEINRQVDGVIAVNLALAKRILEVTGPVSLPDFGEKVSSENLFDRAVYQSEATFFPGSSNKKDFLGSLAKVLFAELKSSNFSKQFQFANVLLNSIKEKNLQVFLPQAQTEVRKIGLDGSLNQSDCAQETCIEDPLFLVDTNVGVNKVNNFLKREITHSININKNEISHDVKIKFTNESKSDSWPAGRYKNYFRIYLSPLAKVQSLAAIDKAGGATEIKNYETSLEHYRKAIATLVEVPVGESRLIDVKYSITASPAPGTTYYLRHQKQSGTKDDLSLEVNSQIPIRLLKTSSSDQPALTPQLPLKYNTPLSQDEILQLQF